MKLETSVVYENGTLAFSVQTDSGTIGIHWRPSNKHDPYYNGYVDTETWEIMELSIERTLQDGRIWIDDKDNTALKVSIILVKSLIALCNKIQGTC